MGAIFFSFTSLRYFYYADRRHIHRHQTSIMGKRQAVQRRSRHIVSNQAGPHERLAETVRTHLTHPFQKPVQPHTRAAFEHLQACLTAAGAAPDVDRALILDACCGVGDSSRHLAVRHPDCRVIGVDRSAHRLARHRDGRLPDHLILLRADLVDLYRLMRGAGWRLARHCLFYPNPYPKAAHLGRRWHGSPVFPDMLALGGMLEVRSNWRVYVDEFAGALRLCGIEATVEPWTADSPVTAFERKYRDSGHGLWRLCADVIGFAGAAVPPPLNF